MTTTGDLRDWLTGLRRLSPVDDAERIELLGLLEDLKCAAAGAQARLTADFDESQRAEQRAAGLPESEVGRGITAQVALARRESPHRGARLVGLARGLEEMPHTSLALSRGQISEWRATLLVRETACLTRQDRAVAQESRRIAYRLDPHAFTRRASRAEAERCVTVRPAPDTMTYLTGLLPVREGVAVFAALAREADSLRSTGDARSRGQIMADTLVERVTGQTTASAVPVEVQLVMTDTALLADDDTPADVDHVGPVPAAVARAWLRDPAAAVWVRRLYTAPSSDRLVAMDSTRRCFTGTLRRFITVRDGRCRTPWCDAPIRHLDHARGAADGGETSALNGQGLCMACNLAKEAPGWRSTVLGAEGTVDTATPTGHRYRSPVPPGPAARGPSSRSPVEVGFRHLVLSA